MGIELGVPDFLSDEGPEGLLPQWLHRDTLVPDLLVDQNSEKACTFEGLERFVILYCAGLRTFSRRGKFAYGPFAAVPARRFV
jgi:hypothetical protein